MARIDVKKASILMQCMEKLEFYTRSEIEEGSTAIKREINREILSRPQNDEGNYFTLKLIGLSREVCLCELIMKLTSYGLTPTWIKVDDFSKAFIHAFVICDQKVEKFVNIKIKLSGQDVMTSSPLRSLNYFLAKGYEHSMIKWTPNDESPPKIIILTRQKNSEVKQKAIPSISDYYCAILKGYSKESIAEFVTRYFNESDMPVPMLNSSHLERQRRSQERFLDYESHPRFRSRSPLNYPERSHDSDSSHRYNHIQHSSSRERHDNRDKILDSIDHLEKQNQENVKHLQGVKSTIENFQRQVFKLEQIIQEANDEIYKLKSQLKYL